MDLTVEHDLQDSGRSSMTTKMLESLLIRNVALNANVILDIFLVAKVFIQMTS